MAVIKGSSQSGTKIADLLADIETALTTAGWSDLGEYTDGTYTFHGWKSSTVNSGHLDWVVVFRRQNDGAGILSMYSGEDWRSTDGKIQKPTVGQGSRGREITEWKFQDISETTHTTGRVWLERDGGDNTVGPPYGSYLSAATPPTEAWWWELPPGDSYGAEYKPVFRADLIVEDLTLTQWIVAVNGDSVFVSTYRWNDIATDYITAWCNDVFLPWAADPLICSASRVSSGIAGHRAYMHPEYIANHISPDYGTDVGTSTTLSTTDVTEPATRALSVESIFWYTNWEIVSQSYLHNIGAIGNPTISRRYGNSLSGGGPMLRPLGVAAVAHGSIVINSEGTPFVPYGSYSSSRYFAESIVFVSSIPNIWAALNDADGRVKMGDEIQDYDGAQYVFTGIQTGNTLDASNSDHGLWVRK